MQKAGFLITRIISTLYLSFMTNMFFVLLRNKIHSNLITRHNGNENENFFSVLKFRIMCEDDIVSQKKTGLNHNVL